MRPVNVLVWAVYPPTAGWRGEGITQTVENILLNAPPQIRYTLILSAAHLPIAREALGDAKNVRLISLGLNFKRIKVWQDIKLLLKSAGPPEDFSTKMARVAEIVGDYFLSVVSAALMPISKLAVWRHVKRADVIYNPSPVYALLSYKKIPKVFNFWDPFGFEYSAFGVGRRRELHRFMFRYYVKASAVITQSLANRQYLEQVWQLDPRSISVIYNGSPDYGPIFREFINRIGMPLTRGNVLAHWPRKKIAGFNKHDALATLLSDTLNISALFRLVNSLTASSKIIMISTQYRPYKGFEALFNVLDALILAAPEYDFRFVITAELPDKIRDRFNGKYAWETERVYEMTRLSNLQHACMYSLSDVVLHPSFAEGGPTQYPASEAASVGVPSLTNLGRHTREMLARDGDSLACVVADFLKRDETVSSILRLIRDPRAREENVSMVESARLHWSEIGAEYGKVFEAFRKT